MITLDTALNQFRADTSTANAEILWSLANSYQDWGTISEKSLHDIYEEIAASGAFD